MVQQHIFENKRLPDHFKCQVLSFQRIVWWEGFIGKNRLRNWITKEEMHPVSFLLEEEGILISYVEVVWKYLEHRDEKYKVYGLTGVFTYPAFRKQGYGLQLLKTAKKYIEEKSDADLVMFHSSTRGFYEKAGFIPMETIETLVGDPNNPKKSKDTAFMLFLSDKGKAAQKDFETQPVYFGEETW